MRRPGARHRRARRPVVRPPVVRRSRPDRPSLRPVQDGWRGRQRRLQPSADQRRSGPAARVVPAPSLPAGPHRRVHRPDRRAPTACRPRRCPPWHRAPGRRSPRWSTARRSTGGRPIAAPPVHAGAAACPRCTPSPRVRPAVAGRCDHRSLRQRRRSPPGPCGRRRRRWRGASRSAVRPSADRSARPGDRCSTDPSPASRCAGPSRHQRPRRGRRHRPCRSTAGQCGPVWCAGQPAACRPRCGPPRQQRAPPARRRPRVQRRCPGPCRPARRCARPRHQRRPPARRRLRPGRRARPWCRRHPSARRVAIPAGRAAPVSRHARPATPTHPAELRASTARRQGAIGPPAVQRRPPRACRAAVRLRRRQPQTCPAKLLASTAR